MTEIDKEKQTGGRPPLWRNDGEKFSRNEDGTYSMDNSMMAAPHRYTFRHLMDTGEFSVDPPSDKQTVSVNLTWSKPAPPCDPNQEDPMSQDHDPITGMPPARYNAEQVTPAVTCSPIPGTGFYRNTKEGTFGELDFWDLMVCVQNGGCSCARAKDIIMRERQALLENQPKHEWWGAGESGCPKDIKASNGELHTMRCKKCGKDNPRSQICMENEKNNDTTLPRISES